MTSTNLLLGWLVFLSLSVPLAVAAQVVPDATLGNENSRVRRATVRGREADLIEGGAARGRNLFHSFREFGVREGDAAYFANPINIENIFGRVTGNNPSNILGTLGVDGAANLFLMNPNGILFGPNASLDIQGSFMGTTANTIQFGNFGWFSTTDGTAPGLLTVNPSAFFFNQVASQGGTIANRGHLITGQDLTLAGNTLDLQGHLTAGRNLTLEARDTLRIRDSATTPFVAAAVGQMQLQGDRVVDIFALNHPNSGLVSGGDMVLRSANQVGGDAHFWSGGNFRIERLNGSLGDLYSPHDPIIRVTGDLTFNNYVGNSLHILAGGSVVVPGTIVILGADTPATTRAETIPLSDGTEIEINGSTQPTLDIRAGVNPSAVVVSNGFEQIGSGNFPGGGTFFRTPTSAGIVLGSVIIVPPDGQVLITNQYLPNPTLPSPDILITGRGISRLGAASPVLGIDARGFAGNGSAVTLDARGQILLFRERSIDSSAELGQSGNVRLLADAGIALGNLASINAYSENRGGDISLSTNGEVSLGIGSSILTSGGGNIRIQSDQLTMEPLSQISAPVNNIRDGGNITLLASDFIRINGGNIGTFVAFPLPSTDPLPEFGDTGDIRIETGTLELTGFVIPAASSPIGFLSGGDITSDVTSNADAGDITITAEQVRLLNGAQIRASTSGAGNAGNVTLRASDVVEVTGRTPETDQVSKIATSVNRGATGNGGDLLIETNRLIVQDQAQIQAGVFGAGQGGALVINAPQSIEIISTADSGSGTGIFTGPEGSEASGNGSTLNITTGQLTLQGDGAQISNEVDSESTGNSGNTLINVNRLVARDGGRIRTGTLNTGQGGNLEITAASSVELSGVSSTGEDAEPSGILTGTFGLADAGDLLLTTPQLIIQGGAAITASTVGLGQDTSAGTGRGGNITINADTIEIAGESAGGLSSNIVSEAGSLFGILNPKSQAPGGTIRLMTRQLTVQDGATISTQTVGAGNAGDLLINATGTVQLLEGDLRTRTTGTGNAGDLTIAAGQLTMQNGEATAATNSGGGRGGNIFVAVGGTTELIGGQGGLAATSFRSGDAGNLSLQTNRLIVRDGAGVITESIGRGQAGHLSIIAPNGVDVNGGRFVTGSEANTLVNNELPGVTPFDPNQTYFFPSRISAQIASPAGTPAANLSIQTGQLTVRDGGEITTQTLGPSRGGRLSINASQINLIGNSGNLRVDVESNPSLLSARTSDTGDAGDIQLDVRQLQINNGAAISAAAVARMGDSTRGRPGSISIRNADLVRLTTNGEISTVIEPGVSVNSSAPDSGSIEIQTRQLSVNSGAEITASTSGRGNAGDITIRDANIINLNRGNISTAVNAGAIGQGGSINLETGVLSLNNRSTITSSTSGEGDTGSINADANERITLDNGSSVTSTVNPGATGDSQTITLTTPNLSLQDESLISAATSGDGSAGDIQIQAVDSVLLSNSTISTQVQRNAVVLHNQARTSTRSNANQGNITIDTNLLSLVNGAQITASTNGQGDAGDVTVRDAQTIFLNDNSRISTEVQRQGRGSGGSIRLNTNLLRLNNSEITANTQGQGDAGNILVRNADTIALNQSTISSAVGPNSTGQGGNIDLVTNSLNLDNARISARTQAQGRGGDVTINASDRINASNSDIETRSESSSSGNITVTAGDIRLRGDSDIRTQVNQGRGTGGTITLSADSIVAFDDSDIVTRAPEGQGGDIRFETPAFFGEGYIADFSGRRTVAPEADGNNRVDVDASGVRSGVVTAPDVSFIQNSLADLPAGAIDTDQLLANSCIARTNQDGTFLITGTGGLPAAPGNDAASSYPTGEVREIPASEAGSSWQPGEPIVEPQGVYRLPDGRLVMSRECSE
ncbi:filamentous hemagglutinin N-terminal domain-containing protein [Leptolyngbya sp. NK1-12]|uniref:Filamentous hemagglutinin N-terminal domain-containing protein n=1 Tax=Leptolyngbya sp. NK1-12 TaxID=2547451 RepID=A0AA97AE25_9CYAN|nr:filamentous hemagglutinin N-terminal domain-containing protein [Leptolyngbya sp. NK1-12]WNZ21525.1 filamentous hemagglutinin N-terminal domain-containing protein [Leptolyngbya sp. NK1-12]